MNNQILPLGIINDQSIAPFSHNEKTKFAVRFWTDEDFNTERKKENIKKILLFSFGWALILIFGTLFERRMLTGWNIILGGAMLTIGWYIVVIKGLLSIFMHSTNKASVSGWRFADQQPDWFQEMLCSNCVSMVNVNTRYLEYTCDVCNRKNRSIGRPNSGSLTTEVSCEHCFTIKTLETQHAWMLCPSCKTKVILGSTSYD